MTQEFLLVAQPRWLGFKLRHGGEEEERKFDSVAEAIKFVRTIPDSKDSAFVVLDDRGREMARLTV